ncbi:MAG: alpha-amylase [Kosmotogaceae bacterium]|nr:alpha-amylase [Kosmotogaceae bacterium]
MFYELYLRSFFDGNGDGIGDLIGAERKLNYLADLGIEGIWLLPILHSPSYHGYSVIDFFSVNPIYGTLKDLRNFLASAHKLGLKVILDLPMNHTSPNHEWFLKALDGEEPYRDWYLFLKDERWLKARRHWDGEQVWTNYSGQWVYTLFGPGSPDLNYESSSLWQQMKEVLTFWLSVGFDGFRFDAAKHIFDFSLEKGICEYQHSRNIAFWKDMTAHCRSISPNSIFVSEVWDDARIVDLYSAIFGIGFNFPLAEDLKTSIATRDPELLVKSLRTDLNRCFRSKRSYESGVFLSNHDMSRLVSVMNGDEELSLLAMSVLLSLPGVPFFYYGEELGMEGVYNMYFNEEQLEPFLWFENGYGPGQTEWKALGKNHPHSGRSLEAQKAADRSYFERFRAILEFRKDNSWLRLATIRGLRRREDLVIIRVVGESRSAYIYHNLGKKRVAIEESTDLQIINGSLGRYRGKRYLGKLSSAIEVSE